jgi:hypothetical protein
VSQPSKLVKGVRFSYPAPNFIENIMTEERLKELVAQALDMSLFESVTSSYVVEGQSGSGRVEIPLVFAKNFASLVLKEKT